MKFASISLNGNTIYNLKNIKGNLSPELTDIISTLNDTIDEKVIGKLIDRLNSYEYDIIAAQEVLNEDAFKNKILEKGYKIYHTENLSKSTRFFSAFLVKEKWTQENNFTIENMNLDLPWYKNRFVEIFIKNSGNQIKLKLLNVHNPDDKRATLTKLMEGLNPNEENIILLGDFNAAKESQRNDESNRITKKKVIKENTTFLDDIAGRGFADVGRDDDFTYKTVGGTENKIDHVFFSDALIKTLVLDKNDKWEDVKDKVKIVREVNYMENGNDEKGITDHCMLEFEINF